MLVPPSLVPSFEKVSAAFVQGVPTSVQAVVAEFIEEGYFATHIRRMRRLYEERHDALVRGGASASSAACSTSCRPRAGCTRSAISRAGSRRSTWRGQRRPRRITVSPIARFSIEKTEVNGLVLGFAGIKPAEIKSGVAVLSEVLQGLARPKRRAGVRR